MGIKDDIRMPGGDRTKLNKERDRAQASMLFFHFGMHVLFLIKNIFLSHPCLFDVDDESPSKLLCLVWVFCTDWPSRKPVR